MENILQMKEKQDAPRRLITAVNLVVMAFIGMTMGMIMSRNHRWANKIKGDEGHGHDDGHNGQENQPMQKKEITIVGRNYPSLGTITP